MRLVAPLLTLLATGATAQEGSLGFGLAFDGGLGVQSAPGYFGAGENETGVTGSFELERFRLGGFAIGGEEVPGLGFTGSFRYIADRRAEDFAGRNPSKQKRSLGMPATDSAAIAAQAPGTGLTARPAARTSRTRR